MGQSAPPLHKQGALTGPVLSSEVLSAAGGAGCCVTELQIQGCPLFPELCEARLQPLPPGLLGDRRASIRDPELPPAVWGPGRPFTCSTQR